MERRQLLGMAPLLLTSVAYGSTQPSPDVNLDTLARFYNALNNWNDAPAGICAHPRAIRTLAALFELEDLPVLASPWGGLLRASSQQYNEVYVITMGPWNYPSTYTFTWDSELFSRTKTSPEDVSITSWYSLRDFET